MKRLIAVMLLVGLMTLVVAPVVHAQEEQITWSELKCRYNPRCK
jgi:hypothetical protein